MIKEIITIYYAIVFQISIYQPNNGKGFPVADAPPSPPDDHSTIYSYHELPSKYWKKYQYAAKFVQLVRTKTPKVTVYTKHAKCMLMENAPGSDFEACFYDGMYQCPTLKALYTVPRLKISVI